MAVLKPAQLVDLKRLLAAREKSLRAYVRKSIHDRLGRDISDLEASGGDDSEQSIANLLEGIDTSILARDIEELLAIESARKRIGNGSYGLCATCNAPIGFKRLLAMPASERCLDCQERHELTSWTPPEATL
jgi:DnaK suppressor protein